MIQKITFQELNKIYNEPNNFKNKKEIISFNKQCYISEANLLNEWRKYLKLLTAIDKTHGKDMSKEIYIYGKMIDDLCGERR